MDVWRKARYAVRQESEEIHTDDTPTDCLSVVLQTATFNTHKESRLQDSPLLQSQQLPHPYQE